VFALFVRFAGDEKLKTFEDRIRVSLWIYRPKFNEQSSLSAHLFSAHTSRLHAPFVLSHPLPLAPYSVPNDSCVQIVVCLGFCNKIRSDKDNSN